GEIELLVLVQLADGDHDRTHGLRALRGAVQERALDRDVVGQAVQPSRVVVGEPGGRVADPGVCGGSVGRGHVVPPSDVCHGGRIALFHANTSSRSSAETIGKGTSTTSETRRSTATLASA